MISSPAELETPTGARNRKKGTIEIQRNLHLPNLPLIPNFVKILLKLLIFQVEYFKLQGYCITHLTVGLSITLRSKLGSAERMNIRQNVWLCVRPITLYIGEMGFTPLLSCEDSYNLWTSKILYNYYNNTLFIWVKNLLSMSVRLSINTLISKEYS